MINVNVSFFAIVQDLAEMVPGYNSLCHASSRFFMRCNFWFNPSLINVRDAQGYTGLHLAIIKGDLALATMQVESGADVLIEPPPIKGRKLTTFDLLFKSQASESAIIHFLSVCQKNFDVFTWKNSFKNTLLHLAVIYNKPLVLQFLASQAGGNIDAANLIGNTPLHCVFATTNTHICEMVTLLINNKANIYYLNNRSQTPLDEAVHLCKFYGAKAEPKQLAAVTRAVEIMTSKNVNEMTETDDVIFYYKPPSICR
jgi:ankyrin repeat protein